MPSQKQLKWSQLRVGITVIVASSDAGFLLFLMSGTSGLFTLVITLKSYFDNAEGLRVGAPVRLSGVDIGNVTKIAHRADRQAADSGRSHDEGQHEVRLWHAPRFGDFAGTAGVLGETYLDIDSSQAVGAPGARRRHAAHAGASRFQPGSARQPEHACRTWTRC